MLEETNEFNKNRRFHIILKRPIQVPKVFDVYWEEEYQLKTFLVDRIRFTDGFAHFNDDCGEDWMIPISNIAGIILEIVKEKKDA